MSIASEKSSLTRDLKQCVSCARRFNADRIKVHEAICVKSSGTARKSFDISRQRIKGTEAEEYVKHLQKNEYFCKSQETPSPTYYLYSQRNRPPTLSTNWRQKHEEFIKKIKDIKKSLMDSEEKNSDLSMLPPVDVGKFVKCPHCFRQINQASAERHILACATAIYEVSKSSLRTNAKSKSSQDTKLNLKKKLQHGRRVKKKPFAVTKFGAKMLATFFLDREMSPLNMANSRNVPTLKEFIIQRKVIKLYRDFFRVTKEIPDKEKRKEVQDWIRADFKSKKDEKDDYAIKMYIQNGERSLREFKSNISLSK